MVHTRKPVFKTSVLNINLEDTETEGGVAGSNPANTSANQNNNNNNNEKILAAVKIPSSTGSVPKSGTAMPTSWQGFDMKTDPKIRRQAKKSWFDLDDASSTATTPFVSASPFEGISGNIPAFPPPSAESEAPAAAVAVEQPAAEVEEKADASPSTPEKKELSAPAVSSPPLKPGEQDADGAEGFEQQQPVQNQLPAYAQVLPPPQQFNPYNPYAQYQQPLVHQQFGPRSFQPQAGGFMSHHHQEQARIQQHHQMPPPPPPAAPKSTRSGKSSGSNSPAPESEAPTGLPKNLTSRPANHELMGFLPFYKFDEMALTGDLPSGDMIGADAKQNPKLFLGHVWSRVPTGVVQWMLNSFGPSGSTAFGPQLHYNREGWFRGCLHVSVVTEDVQALIYALHKRVLFDHEGVWFAETADQMRILDDYCKRLRALPQQIRHTKLQSLPCNPLACELARNE